MAPCLCGFSAYLGTLFLGALNDNISKLLTICYATAVLSGSSSSTAAFLSLAGGCFILPYLLFSNIAGYLADRFSKKTVMVWSKVAEILIMFLGWLLASHGAVYGLLAVLFCMGTQSAFFSPAKYGFLPETQPSEKLSRANGIMQLFTFSAIIIGGWAGGMLSARYSGNIASGFLYCIAIAVAGTIASFFITRTKTGQRDLKYHFADPLSPHWKTLRELSRDRILLHAVAGNAYFWFAGTVIQLLLVLFVKNTLGGNDKLVGLFQAAVAIGIATGCCLAGYLSRKSIPYHFIVPGGLAMAAGLLLLGIVGPLRTLAISITMTAGFCSGFFELPLSTAMQERSPADRRGRYLAATNAVDCLAMLSGSLYLYIMPAWFHCGPRISLAVLSLLTFCMTLVLKRGLKSAK